MKATIIAAALALPLAATAGDITGVVDKTGTQSNGWRWVTIVGMPQCPDGSPMWFGPSAASDDLSTTARMSKLVGIPITITVDTSAGWCVIQKWTF